MSRLCLNSLFISTVDLCLGGEWKARYETQVKVNEHLCTQVVLLNDKIKEAKHTLKDG